MNRLDQVIEMVQRGLYVYPIVPNGKQPIKNYSYLKATQDIALIESWFRQEPNINIGIDLSKSNLVVVDIDNHNNDLQAPLQSLSNLGYNLPSDYVERTDRKSTRLNSSHVSISYAVFCLKKNTSDQSLF